MTKKIAQGVQNGCSDVFAQEIHNIMMTLLGEPTLDLTLIIYNVG